MPEDNGKFKIPTLRNIELTAPCMHNGSLQTIEEAVEYFNSGGVGHPNQSKKIEILNLTEDEKTDLVALLKNAHQSIFRFQS